MDTVRHYSTLKLIPPRGIHLVEYCFESFNSLKCVEENPSMWKCVSSVKQVTTAPTAGF